MRTLELGARLGEHLRFEDLEAPEYHAIELRQSMAEAIYLDYRPGSPTDNAERLRAPVWSAV